MNKKVKHGVWILVGMFLVVLLLVTSVWFLKSSSLVHLGHIAHGMSETVIYDLPMSDIIPKPGDSTSYGIPLSLDNTQQFIEWFYTLELSPSEEAVRAEALKQLQSPCCDDYTMLTCCCECNLVYSVWGLTAHLAQNGYSSDDILEAYGQWLHFIRPDYYIAKAMETENIPIEFYGLTLDQSCYTGRCEEPFLTIVDNKYLGGCAGMGDVFKKGYIPFEDGING